VSRETKTYPLRDVKSIDDLEQGLPKPYTVMGVVEAGKAQNCLLELTPRRHFLDPVTGNNEIAVSVIGLPGVTGEVNLAGDLIALFQRLRPFEHRIEIGH
jgi:hypothetical protein